jgi:hypothetical protein
VWGNVRFLVARNSYRRLVDVSIAAGQVDKGNASAAQGSELWLARNRPASRRARTNSLL